MPINLRTAVKKLACRKGQSVVEAAIIIPIMLFIIMIMVYLGMFIFTKSMVLYSAHQGGKEALNFRTNNGYSEDQKVVFIRNAVLNALAVLPAGNGAPAVSISKDMDSGLMKIRSTYYFKLQLPFISQLVGNESIPITSEVTYRFAPPSQP